MKYKHVIIFDRKDSVANLHNSNNEIEQLLLSSPIVAVIDGEEKVIGMVDGVLYSEHEDRFYGDVWINDKYARERFEVKYQDVEYDGGNAGGVVATSIVTYVE